MATFLEMMQKANGNLGTAFQNPWTQLGLQLMAAGGQQPGDPTLGQRFAQAGQGFMNQQAQQAELQQQQLLRQIQLGQLNKQVKAQEMDEQTRQMVRDRVKSDSSILANSPLARAVLEATGDISGIADLAKIGQPAAPKAPFTYEENLPGGERQQYIWDPSTGGYRATAPYRPTQQQAIDQRAQQFQQTQEFKQQQANTQQQQWQAEQGVREQNASASADRASTAAAAEFRKSENAVRERKVEQAKMQSQYRIADKRFEDAEQRIQTLINHPGLKGNYGLYGTVGNLPGADAANARALLSELRETLSFSELNQLKQMGVNLAPITEAERDAAGKSVANLENAQDYGAVQSQLNKALAVVQRSREEARTLFNQLDGIYGQQPQQRGAGAQPSGGHAKPQTQADFDALPAGSLYIDPDDGKLYRK